MLGLRTFFTGKLFFRNIGFMVYSDHRGSDTFDDITELNLEWLPDESPGRV
jgi:hypothetical protein